MTAVWSGGRRADNLGVRPRIVVLCPLAAAMTVVGVPARAVAPASAPGCPVLPADDV